VIETPVESVKGCKHPAIYPVRIVEEFLQLLTCPGDVVLEPFMGSGSTAVACKRLNRWYIGYEINTDYYEEARRRVTETMDDISCLF
jgi:site-specific DNA-methyltransferase (adenine-specific)